MRWFKHMTASSDDEKLSKLEDQYGLEGYGFWWKIVEIVAAKVGDDGQTLAEFSPKKWGSLLRISPKKFQTLAESCANLGLFFVKYEKNLITIDMPNILKYRDEWSSRRAKKNEKLGSYSRVTPGKLMHDPDPDPDPEYKKEEYTTYTCREKIPDEENQVEETQIEENATESILRRDSCQDESLHEKNENARQNESQAVKAARQEKITEQVLPVTGKNGCPNCLHERVIDLYHAELPMLPKVRTWTGTRPKNLQVRWRETYLRLKQAGQPCDSNDILDWWKKYFGRVRASPFLVGKVTYQGRPFFADLAWLVKPENYAKVIEGKYLDRKSA